MHEIVLVEKKKRLVRLMEKKFPFRKSVIFLFSVDILHDKARVEIT